ncbi:hypothetical protein L484_016833 [Morus notabilis]|uniref:Cyclin-dependent protein kinase inhibitor SMR3 n=1 Tax=Morus notabilis TaxID=981085 RepID=W9QPA6_9ROSA|nr:hypothetical protein L484_016833 [Morus notabilis]
MGLEDEELRTIMPLLPTTGPNNKRKEELLCLDDEEECRTPRRLPGDDMLRSAPLVCPPAPRKARQASCKKLRPPSQGFFKVPDDLASVFMVLPSPLKKIRTS